MRAPMRVRRQARAAEGEFSRYRLAEAHSAGRAQQRYGRCVRSGPVTGIERAAILGRLIASVEDVLDAKHYAGEGKTAARIVGWCADCAGVDGVHLAEGPRGIEVGPGPDH